MKGVWVAFLGLAAAGSWGCGSDESDSVNANGGPERGPGAAGAAAGGGGAPGAGGSSSTPNGGGALGGAQSVAGNASAGMTGAGAAAGTGSAGQPSADAFDPALPQPSVDCRGQVDTKRCVSIRGQVNGANVDAHCTGQALVSLVFEPPRAWVADCTEGESPEVGKQYQVTVPVQKVGAFEYRLAPGMPPAGTSVLVSVDDVGGSSLADHFVAAVVSGTVEDGGLGAALVSGTFHASWGTPTAPCDAGAVGQCGSASVNGTFRILHAVPPQ